VVHYENYIFYYSGYKERCDSKRSRIFRIMSFGISNLLDAK